MKSGGLTQSPAWQRLLKHREVLKTAGLQKLILGDPGRLETCQLMLDGLRLNYALNAVTPETIGLLVKLAGQQNLADERARLFRGDKINVSENRAVLHTALRQKGDQPVKVDGRDVVPDIRAAQRRIETFVDEVRGGRRPGIGGKPMRHIVNIGIGGSDLGPRLAVEALAPYRSKLDPHFVANADAFDLLSALKRVDPDETLFVVVSKTFTTQETLLNAQTARQWLIGKSGDAAVARHFVAVTGNRAEAEKFGIAAGNIFPLWDWVGGRFSLWSAAGLSVALAIGNENVAAMRGGAAAMDDHFAAAPFERNMPVVLALLGLWQRNFCGASAQAILPYSERLRLLPRYLQQLEMESNGKTVTRDGQPADCATAPVMFGECGTVGQHSFHQWLHQGSDIVPADFIGVAEDDLGQPRHHQVLLANMVAQAGALAFGDATAASPQAVCAGGRPSNLIMLDRLDPSNLGMLLALYEHKVFVQGVIWNINSFDQPGVELGKKLARTLESSESPSDDMAAFLNKMARGIGLKHK